MQHDLSLAAAPQGAPLPRPRVCFLYLAQAHQVLHSLSVARELACRRPDLEVDVAASQAEILDYGRLIVDLLGGAPIRWRLLGPEWLRRLRASDGVPPKLGVLAANRRFLGAYDVIVAPERTTAALRTLGLRRTKLVYTQHGAGDRGGPFEPRLGRFDLVFAAGEKQRARMVDEGLVRAERCAVVGYPKFDVVDRLDPPLPHLFADDRPVVLYNPHFDPRLSSWPKWGQAILEQFAAQDRYNLVFAPHLRLFESRPAEAVAELARFRGHPRIHLDLGATTAAIDMTYTRLADVYLGEASSQVYEFIREPGPCVFLDAHRANWKDQESYAHWRFGPVLDQLGDLPAQIDQARAEAWRFHAAQAWGFRRTFSTTDLSASVRAADAVAQLLGAGAVDERVLAPSPPHPCRAAQAPTARPKLSIQRSSN